MILQQTIMIHIFNEHLLMCALPGMAYTVHIYKVGLFLVHKSNLVGCPA